MIELTVGIVVGLVVFSAILMPVVNNSTTTDRTFTNDGLWRMKAIEDGDSWARSSDTGTWIYDGVDSITPASADAGSNIALGDDWCVRANGQLRGHTIGGNPGAPSFVADSDSVDFTPGGGLNGSTEQSLTGFGYSANGDHVMLPYGGAAYMNGDSVLYATGNSIVDGANVIVHIEGTINDADIQITVDSNYSNTGTPVLSNLVISNKQVNYTAVNGFNDLYSLESITFDAAFDLTVNDTTTSYSGAVSYSSYVVPYQVTAELSQHLDSDEIQLIRTIPILIIAGLIVGIAAAVVSRRE